MIQEDRLLRYSRLSLLLLVFLIAVLTRLAFLEHRGFLDSDEGAYYRFFSTELVHHSFTDYAPAMWARHIYFWLLYFWSHFFGVTPYLFLYHNAVLGIITVALVYLISKKIFGQTAGIFAAAFLAVSFNHIFHVRHMKDFSTTIFLFTVSLLALIMFLETEKKKWIVIAGISLGMMSGSNPASYPTAGILFIFLLVLFSLKFFRRIPSKRTPILTRFFLFSISYILPLACIELFYPLAKYLLPSWNIDTKYSYLRSLTGHLLGNRPDALGIQKEGLMVYLKGFSTDGIFFISMAFVGTIIILLKLAKERRSVYILIAASSWGCVLIYAFYPNISDYFRNVLTSLVGMAILSGLAISSLTELVYKYIKKSGLKIILETALVIMIISYGYSYSRICLKNVSAAQQMHDYIQVDRASMTEPSRPVYYWEHYYFQDRNLSVNTWEEVFRNYLSRRAEYLVLLIPPWTKATEILESKYKPTKIFKHLTSDRKQIEFGLFDLNQERLIFTERFNFHLIDKIDCPGILTLPCYDGRMLECNLHPIATRFEIKTIKDANLLLLNGRVPIHRPGDLLTVMIGDKENPNRYYLEMFPAKKSLTSIHTTWQLEDNIPPEIIISLYYTNNMDDFSGRSIEISGFELSLYHLPEEHKRLAAEVLTLKANEKKIETSVKY
jgi:4-amino-4-deoxy-L-arabinose transferase-like glycosyltransferase